MDQFLLQAFFEEIDGSGDNMTGNPFQTRTPQIEGNTNIRKPQREAYLKLVEFVDSREENEREVGIVLPVGCGKSGCIALAPFAFKSERTLIVAPGIAIAKQLYEDFDLSSAEMFYRKREVLEGKPFPEPAEIRGTLTNKNDLDEAHVVVTNIHQLQRENNSWIQSLPYDFFDLILFDEGHHNVAESWLTLKRKFPNAKIINFSATPFRADGQKMAGRILYAFSVFQAIQEGYVKNIKAIALNPKTLRYVRNKDGKEINVDLDEIRRLGEEDSDFRRSIVTSSETLNAVVDASIRELKKLRSETGENRLKIIVAALNYANCNKIVEAYTARGLRADFVHSREESDANNRVLERLENHKIDVIVQVRKLGEGFDHKFLAVAAVLSLFKNLSPFVQFVGRIMRVIKPNAPGDILNKGVVVFHAGANVASRWKEFQDFSELDKEFYDQLLPTEDIVIGDELEISPCERKDKKNNRIDISEQENICIEEIPLLKNDPEAMCALKTLQAKGYTSAQITTAFEELDPIQPTKQRQRQAKRKGLEQRVQSRAGEIIARRSIKCDGHELDIQRLGKTNFVIMKSAIDTEINAFIGHNSGTRKDFNLQQLELIDSKFDELAATAEQKVFDGN